jgi:polyisoprenoid-binding protein YceI
MRLLAVLLLAGSVVAGFGEATSYGQEPKGGAVQGGTAAPRPPLPTFDTSRPARLEIVEAKARYKVQEQLVGVNFPNEATGTTEAVQGVLVITPDGSLKGSQITVDLRTLKTDQELRDNYIRTRVLETEKFPTLVFVPQRVAGLPLPLASPPQPQALGFELIGDMTIRGVTKQVTWRVVGTLRGGTVGGQASTALTFAQFELPKPAVPLLLSVEDKIQLEVEFRTNRSAL